MLSFVQSPDQMLYDDSKHCWKYKAIEKDTKIDQTALINTLYYKSFNNSIDYLQSDVYYSDKRTTQMTLTVKLFPISS